MTKALWNTNGRIYELLQFRRELLEYSPGELASIEEANKAIRTYVVQEVSENPNSIHQFLLENRARQMDLKAEVKRLQGLLSAEEGEEALAEHIVKEVLHEIGEKSLQVRGTLRIQNNGGLAPLDVRLDLLPLKFAQKTITLTGHMIGLLLLMLSQIKPDGPESLVAKEAFIKALNGVKAEPNNDLIRQAIGNGEAVPGARLEDRGQHLRVS